MTHLAADEHLGNSPGLLSQAGLPSFSTRRKSGFVWAHQVGGPEMIQIIDRSNAHLYEDTLESFAELRYEVFIKRFGWKFTRYRPGFEQDQFDTKDAVYLVVQN